MPNCFLGQEITKFAPMLGHPSPQSSEHLGRNPSVRIQSVKRMVARGLDTAIFGRGAASFFGFTEESVIEAVQEVTTSNRSAKHAGPEQDVTFQVPAASCYWVKEMTIEGSWAEQAADDPAVMSADLFTVHAQAVFAVCLANTRNYHDAEDVMQSVFLKANGKISSLRDPARARDWLLQVARRACIDFHRRRKPTDPLLDDPPTPTPSDNALCERLHEAIQALPQNYREVIALYYMDGRDCSSVAASLGVTEPAIRQRLLRARSMLHDLLREDRP